MLILRSITLVMFSTLLFAIAWSPALGEIMTNPCKIPPDPQSSEKCYYWLQIAEVISDDQVKAKVAKSILEHQNKEAEKECHRVKKEHPDEPMTCPDPKEYKNDAFPVTVEGGTSQLKVGKDYKFDSIPNKGHLKLRAKQ